jgi:hypothetical protein
MDAAIRCWGTGGEFYVAYPNPNVWNEHPYSILDVPWSDAQQRKAAADFLTYLTNESVQRRVPEHGFRPGDPQVSVTTPESPLVRHQRSGRKIHLPVMSEPPTADVNTNLLGSFRRVEPGH